MKPDDVSQEAWDAARRIHEYDLDIDPWGAVDAAALCTGIARAITAAVAAEREACWLKADEIAADFFSLRAPYSAHGATKVSDAIRARSTP